MYYLDRNIKNLVRVFDQNERKNYLRLDLNENPGGLPEEFVKQTLSNVKSQLVAQYPETLHFTEVLARYLGTDIQHLCLVNGSAEGIRYIIQAFYFSKWKNRWRCSFLFYVSGLFGNVWQKFCQSSV